jgi:hypothetical protein
MLSRQKSVSRINTAEAISSWLTMMAQRSTPSWIIDMRMQYLYKAFNYLENKSGLRCGVYDIVTGHFGVYEEMVAELEFTANQTASLFDAINSFLSFVANEYNVDVSLLKVIKNNTGRNRQRLSTPHMKLISIIKRMSAKQKRDVLGVLLERHRELKEIDDIMRKAW